MGPNTIKKFAIVSDIHGNIAALERVVEDIQSRQVDCVINLGDHVSGPLWPKETIQTLMKQDWIQIKGNHDRQLVTQEPKELGLSDAYAFPLLNNAELGWLRDLPANMELQETFMLFHGAPSCDTTYLLETVDQGSAKLATDDEIHQRLGKINRPVILCGHTHIPRVVELPNLLIVNPGSVGLQAYEDEIPEHHVMETGSPHARYAIMELGDDGWKTELVAIPYDHLTAAKRARRNGRLDWEAGLRTGFM